MALYEDQLAVMNSGIPPEGYAAALRGDTQLTTDYGAIVSPTEEQLVGRGVLPAATNEGSRLITNDPRLQRQADVYIQPPPQAAVPVPSSSTPQGQRDFLDDFEQRIAKAPDFLSKQRLINELADSAQQRLGAAQQSVMRIAEEQVNLKPELAQLGKMVEMDRRNRDLAGRDSEETAKQRAKVLGLEQLAQKQTQELIKNNPQIASFTSRVKNNIELHSKMAERELATAEKLLAKKEAEQDAAQQIVAMIDPEARKAISVAHPAMSSDIEFAKFVTQGGGKSKDWAPILQGTIRSGDYLNAALEGNGAARQLAISEYAARTGKPVQEAEQQIRYAETLAKNPAAALETATKYGIFNPTEAKNIAGKFVVADSATRKQLNASIIAKIPDIMEKRTVATVQNNPIHIAQTINDPAYLEAATLAQTRKQAGQVATGTDVSLAYINMPNLTAEERANRVESVSDAYAKALVKEGSNGILHTPFERGQIEMYKANFKKSLTAKTVSDTLASKVGEWMGATAQAANQLMPSAQYLGFHENVIQGTYGFLDELAGGVMKGVK